MSETPVGPRPTIVLCAAVAAAGGSIEVTDKQLREADPYRLHQDYDADRHVWTYTLPGASSSPETGQ